MRTAAAFALSIVLCACSSSNGGNAPGSAEPTPSQSQASAPSLTTVVLRHSVMSFKEAQAACNGALGTLTFSLNHARTHPAPGVILHEHTTATPGVVTMVFWDLTHQKSATVEVNNHARSVKGKNVIAKSNKSVACVGAE